jgi:hypothetical protein
MPFVKSYKYDLFGDATVNKQVGKIYRFKQGEKVVNVPESDTDAVEGFSPGDLQAFVRSYKYNLFGNATVEEQVGTIYRFKQGNKVVDVPASDTDAVEGFQGGAKRINRRNNRGTKKARRNRRRYTRRK